MRTMPHPLEIAQRLRAQAAEIVNPETSKPDRRVLLQEYRGELAAAYQKIDIILPHFLKILLSSPDIDIESVLTQFHSPPLDDGEEQVIRAMYEAFSRRRQAVLAIEAYISQEIEQAIQASEDAFDPGDEDADMRAIYLYTQLVGSRPTERVSLVPTAFALTLLIEGQEDADMLSENIFGGFTLDGAQGLSINNAALPIQRKEGVNSTLPEEFPLILLASSDEIFYRHEVNHSIKNALSEAFAKQQLPAVWS